MLYHPVICVVRFSSHCQTFFQYDFTISPALSEICCCSSSLPKPGILVHVFEFVVVSHCDFKLHFREKSCCYVLFHRLIEHCRIGEGKMTGNKMIDVGPDYKLLLRIWILC